MNKTLEQEQSLLANIERVIKQEKTVDELQSEDKIVKNCILEKDNIHVVTLKQKEEESKMILSEEVTMKNKNLDNVQIKVGNMEEENLAKDPCPLLEARINIPFVKEDPRPSLGTPAAHIKVENTEDVESKREEYIKGLFREYLKEFFESEKYTEMRFLGKHENKRLKDSKTHR